MAKIQIKSERITPFGGIFPIMDFFNRILSQTIDKTLGLRSKFFGYQYSEIIRSLMCIFFCGGTCIEDVSKHLMPYLSQHPKLRTCSSDTILRAIEELTETNLLYTSDSSKSYEFNKAEKLNNLLLDALLTTGQLKKDEEYDFDFDHQYIETEKYDAKTTYKHFYIRANRCSSFYDRIRGLTEWKKEEINNQEFELNSIVVEKWKGMTYRIVIQRQRRTDGDLDLWEGEYTYRCILTNDYSFSDRDIVEFYNQRGGKERIFDEMNNGFGWSHLPKSFMSQNAAFLLLTALIYNFYKHCLSKIKVSDFNLETTSRIKTFIFKFISVPAKWIKAARQDVLNIYSTNTAYANLDFG